MARGTALTVAIPMLKAELGMSQTANTVQDQELLYLLRNKQMWLAAEYDWPFLFSRWNAPAVVGSAWQTFPATDDRGDTTGMNLERPVQVQTYYNGWYSTLDYGIGEEEYNTYDSPAGDTSDRILRWMWSANDTETPTARFEVWPIPSAAQTIVFSGQRQVKAITTTADKLDLDDLLVVLFVAAERLQRADQRDAQAKAAMAQRRLQQLRAAYPAKDTSIVLGGGGMKDKRDRRLVSASVVIVR